MTESLVTHYSLSDQTRELVRATELLLIAGVVGGGKNTVINELIKNDHYHLIISHTTRPSRENHGELERDGVNYHFVSVDEMARLIKDKAFIEVKDVHGNIYGTSASELELARTAGKVAVTDIDIMGVVDYLDIKPETHAIFLIPPSVESWLHRLARRYGDLELHKDEIDRRFTTAAAEIKHIMEDRRFILVVNDDLQTTVDRISQIVRGEREQTSDYAYSVAEHLLEYIKQRLAS